MNQAVKDCLAGKHGSYILPFMWMHGEPHERIKQEILAIKNSGIREFCLESHPYPDFCGEQWWNDVSFILETAKALDMCVWILDDKAFPTGYVNGYLEAPERADLRTKLIRECNVMVPGPMKKAKVLIDEWLKKGSRESVISVVAYRHAEGEKEQLDPLTALDITDTYQDGCVYFDVPEGVWRVCITILADTDHYPPHVANHIDMLNPESCQTLISQIYEPHYAHFKQYFGNTFKGFFSDEPGFYSDITSYFTKLGTQKSTYPWRHDLPELIAESAGVSVEKARALVPSLWEDMGEDTAWFHAHYMDVITKLYAENFCWAMGNWCREHNLLYIGHIIEDCNAHMRTGMGIGHYYRAMDGQDMAGMDTVFFQNFPGVNDFIHRGPTPDLGITDPTFFDYTLPKMAASHAHIQPLKKGRALSEIFGAYGWSAGIPFLKGVVDTLLVSGINHFVPHAFSPKENNPIFPPHFYDGGNNAQYVPFGHLMQYIGRTAHILYGGVHQADIAVFYNAEGEWTGGKNQLFQEICKTLTRGNIDFDVVPYDALKQAAVENGKLCINGERYHALVISESEILPFALLQCFARLQKAGLPIIFTDSLPQKSAEKQDITALLENFETVPTAALCDTLRARGWYDISVKGDKAEHLRFFHTKSHAQDIYMFYNENPYDTLDVRIRLAQPQQQFVAYDAWSNTVFQGTTENGELHLILEKSNALIVTFGGEIPAEIPPLAFETARKPLNLRFDVYVKESGADAFTLYAENSPLIDITAPDRLSHFRGEVLYKTTFRGCDGFNVLDLGQVGDSAAVWLNDEYCGMRANAPYKFNLQNAKADEDNFLEIHVYSGNGHAKRMTAYSQFVALTPTGILGDIALCKYA